jgi:peptidoglycan hydrolase CwlO-like protein
MPQPTLQTRLCPQCANSIAVDASTCPYCKADLRASTVPEWPARSEGLDAPKAAEGQKLPLRSKISLVLGLVVFALGVYLVGGSRERSDLAPILAQQESALQEQEKLLREREQKIDQLEKQLAELREAQQGNLRQIGELKSQLEERQKDLLTAQQRLSIANREIERLAASRAVAATRPTARSAEPAAPPTAASQRRQAEAGVYEAVRPTSVHEEPSGSSRVVAQIGRGTEVTVTRAVGDWLEVRSKHGKPPGFVRADNVRLVGRAD